MALIFPYLKTDRGVQLAFIERHYGFSYVKKLNGIGWFTMTIPGDLDSSLLAVDRQIQFWRQQTPNQPALDFLGFLRRWRYRTGGAGDETITLSGPDQNDLVARRIVAYAADTDQSQTSYVNSIANYPVDSSIVDLANENLGASATDTDRDLSGFSVSFRASEDNGPDIQRAFAWRSLPRIFADLNQASKAVGPETHWMLQPTGVDADGTVNLEFSAFTTYPGGDRSWQPTPLSKPMIFGLRWGNLLNPDLVYDYTDEITVAYAGGPGEGVDREIVEVEDANRSAASIWNRREGFADARNQKTTAAVTAEANELLERGRPRVRFTGTILSNEQTPYGEWGLGSLVTIEYRSIQFNGLIRNVQVVVDENGVETVTSNVEFESSL